MVDEEKSKDGDERIGGGKRGWISRCISVANREEMCKMGVMCPVILEIRTTG